MSDTVNALDLLGAAEEDGMIGQGSLNAFAIPNITAQIQAGLGVAVAGVKAAETLAFGAAIDDSPSIQWIGSGAGPGLVCTGWDVVLDALVASKQGAGVLVHSAAFNGGVIDPFTPLKEAARLRVGKNYVIQGCTPLYRRTLGLLGTLLAKQQEAAETGVPCRTMALIVTDGRDEDYEVGQVDADGNRIERVTSDMVRQLIGELLEESEQNIVCFMGISEDGQQANFRRIAEEMGIPERWVLTPTSDPSDIRRAFQVVSQSAVRASQGGAAFSQAASAGFGGFGK